MRCTVCAFPQVAEVDTLLASGSSIRAVSQIYGLARSTVARHRKHAQVTGSRLGVIQGGSVPTWPPDPLRSALELAGRARTPRERLRGLEAVRAGLKMRLRESVGETSREDRDLLDAGIRDASIAFEEASDYETAVRALAGLREAIEQRLAAAGGPRMVPMPPTSVALSGGTPIGAPYVPDRRRPIASEITVQEYFRDVPSAYRDYDRYEVARRIQLHFGPSAPSRPDEEIAVYERENGALVWKRDGWSAGDVGDSS